MTPSSRWLRALCVAALLASPAAALVADQAQPAPLRIFLRGGPKTHGPADERPARRPDVREGVAAAARRRAARRSTGALTFPTPEQLDNTDVLVMFAANGGNIAGEQRASLEKFLKRGGGIVALHDAVLAREPHWFKTIIGGAWENGVAKYFEGENTYYYVNTEHPITKGASNFTITDEVYWDLHMMPNAQILAGVDAAGAPAARRAAAGRAADRQADPADVDVREPASGRTAVSRVRVAARPPLHDVLVAARAGDLSPRDRVGGQARRRFAGDAG